MADGANRLSGYVHPSYAQSLSEFGEPRLLPGSGGWILVRPILDGDDRDAMGCYPLFACENWSELESDLDELDRSIVSLAAVPDPFGEFDRDDLERWFPVVRPFKEHFVVDLAGDMETFVSSHHRRNARRALESVVVARCDEPRQWLDTWVSLYSVLARRHGLRGIHAFSRRAFAGQLEVPGLVMLRAERDGEVVAMTLWYVHGEVAYYHLGASSDAGYEARANFALFWRAVEHFAAGDVRILDLGAGAGLGADADGLSRFKQGWSTGAVPTYFCGRIFDAAAYRRLTAGRSSGADYFPAYRRGEFA